VDTGGAPRLFDGYLRELPMVGGRQVAPDPHHLRFHEVVVVEKPLGGRRYRLAPMNVIRKGLIGVAQDGRVLVEPPTVASRGNLPPYGA
jgi:hypothetical protein